MLRFWRFRFVRVVEMEVWAEGKRSWEGSRGGGAIGGNVMGEYENSGGF